MTVSPFEMMKKLSALEKNFDAIAKKTGALTTTGESGAGMVKVTVDPEGAVSDIYISDEVFAMNDKNTLITLIKSAFNNAAEKKKEVVKDVLIKASQDNLN